MGANQVSVNVLAYHQLYFLTKCFITEGGIKAGYGTCDEPYRYVTRESMKSRIEVEGYETYALPLRCAPRNIITRRPNGKSPRYPSHMFQHVFHGHQGTNPYHEDKFVATETYLYSEPAFAMIDEDNLCYEDVVRKFNEKNQDINKHVSFIDLLSDIFNHHNKPFDETTLNDSKSDDDYEQIKKQTHKDWNAAFQARKAANVQTIEKKVVALKKAAKKRKRNTGGGSSSSSSSSSR